MSTAIEFDHVGKQYRLGLVSTKTLSHDLNRWWQTSVLKREDPYLKVGETNDRTTTGNSEYVWALRDIDFKIEQGDVVGIIGKNGAGKSTLLKLLSRVTGPTMGAIRARGRIGALLEVGTGFHPEMTGRENIYMNGAIMGMSKAEVSRKLDEIIDFSGCERYIDTPVKRYSSGMTVRLGFAVAAHLDPEILVVDEVLAVGDSEFQKKAIGKMQDVSRGEGRTVLFVSHNMSSIRQLCRHGMLLNNGQMEMSGEVNAVINHYLNGQKSLNDYERKGSGAIRAIRCELESEMVPLGSDLVIDILLHVERDCDLVGISFDIKDDSYSEIAHISNYDDGFNLRSVKKREEFRIRCVLKSMNLAPGSYTANLWIGSPYEMYDWIRECVRFNVTQDGCFIKRETPYDPSARVVIPSNWSLL